MNIYRAVNNETGEIIVGTAKEVAEIIGVSPGTISKYAAESKRLYTHWVFELDVEKTKEDKGRRFLQLEKRKCVICGNEFQPNSNSQKTCGGVACRKANTRILSNNYAEKQKNKKRKIKKNDLNIIALEAKNAGIHYGIYVAQNGL